MDDDSLTHDRTLDHDRALDHDSGGRRGDDDRRALPHDDALTRRTRSAPDHDGKSTHQEATSKHRVFHNVILKQT
jgi:hypothetical protein